MPRYDHIEDAAAGASDWGHEDPRIRDAWDRKLAEGKDGGS